MKGVIRIQESTKRFKIYHKCIMTYLNSKPRGSSVWASNLSEELKIPRVIIDPIMINFAKSKNFLHLTFMDDLGVFLSVVPPLEGTGYADTG